MAASEGKKIRLKSKDGMVFEVEELVAMELKTIESMIEEGCTDGAIPISNVTSDILFKILEYCKKHVEHTEELKAWDADFLKVDMNTLKVLILAANNLNIESLLDLTCQAVADMIKRKTLKISVQHQE